LFCKAGILNSAAFNIKWTAERGTATTEKKMATPIKTTPGQKNVVQSALGDKAKIFLSPLLITIGLK